MFYSQLIYIVTDCNFLFTPASAAPYATPYASMFEDSLVSCPMMISLGLNFLAMA